jgi:Flp pilus assembly protein TadD
MADYEKKYQMTLPAPVQVEIYPDHDDFAVRTLGMPGMSGLLGVTFGEVVAMDSPSGRKPGEFHWASTLRHEMSHVFILTATHHRVPRWFTEGLAVHEQGAASPEWADPMTPDIVAALRDRKLLPVADLDRGFMHPEYPGQVLVSYFEAGQICDFIQSRWGEAKLLDMVHSFASVTTTPAVIASNLGLSATAFDQQFQAWLYGRVASTVANFDEWRQRLKHLNELATHQDDDALLADGAAVIRLYPDYVYEGNAYELLAKAQIAKGKTQDAVAVLTQYEHGGGRSPQALKDLARLEEQLKQPAAAAATLDRINDIAPANDEELHRHLGELWLGMNNTAGAIREFKSVLALHPLDQASAHYQLAQAYFAAGQRELAEDHVLSALESAPSYRPAQKLLLQLKDQPPGK